MESEMLADDQVEELIKVVSGLDKEGLLRQFKDFLATFPVDFTADFLDHQPLERLRHLFVAVCLQSRKLPELPIDETVAA
jgi:hypothetical protein